MVEFKKRGIGSLQVTRAGEGGKGNQIRIAPKVRKKWKCVIVDLGTETAIVEEMRPYPEASKSVRDVRERGKEEIH
jgi:hypothetical protein